MQWVQLTNPAGRDKTRWLDWCGSRHKISPVGHGARSWAQAIFSCVNKNVGGTVGWRLPSVVELTSVRDPSLPAPFVPVSVFTGVQSDFYWSATTNAENPVRAWDVYFLSGLADADNTALNFHVWCVRGGNNADAYSGPLCSHVGVRFQQHGVLEKGLSAAVSSTIWERSSRSDCAFLLYR